MWVILNSGQSALSILPKTHFDLVNYSRINPDHFDVILCALIAHPIHYVFAVYFCLNINAESRFTKTGCLSRLLRCGSNCFVSQIICPDQCVYDIHIFKPYSRIQLISFRYSLTTVKLVNVHEGWQHAYFDYNQHTV